MERRHTSIYCHTCGVAGAESGLTHGQALQKARVHARESPGHEILITTRTTLHIKYARPRPGTKGVMDESGI